ncbi:hypothetical protein DERP_001195 [Dermatophagoides pteronyssinus]|uniref:Uncharacterized protein n=1 Tax=Dermatophagoides pteronyssinus TaxID=6956 RepID=A0ABQ8JDT4_DERPT|nr:hypothetical protein DERP_001195 [Dermatophagoides pteronyssinus]
MTLEELKNSNQIIYRIINVDVFDDDDDDSGRIAVCIDSLLVDNIESEDVADQIGEFDLSLSLFELHKESSPLVVKLAARFFIISSSKLQSEPQKNK